MNTLKPPTITIPENAVEIDERVIQLVVDCIDAEKVVATGSPVMMNALAEVERRFGIKPQHTIELMQLSVEAAKLGIKKRFLQHVAPCSVAADTGELYGQCYTWEHPDGRTWTWSISHAKRIIGNRVPNPKHALTLEMQKMIRDGNEYAADLNLEYAMTTDLSQPLIATIAPVPEPEHGDVLILIDGWHRLLKSIAIGNTEPLQVHVLSKEEMEMCRIERMQK